MPRIEAVVFDIGGVLVDWNPRHLYRKLFAGDDEAMERFLATVCTMEWHYQHDLGRPFHETYVELATLHPEHAELIAAWGERADEMIGDAIGESVELLDEVLASGRRCYALTNWPADGFAACRARFAFLEHFDGIVVSGEERVAKPDPAVFRRLLDRFDLRAGTTLLLDDHEPNIAAARRLGMHAVRFESAAQARAALAEAGVLSPVA